MFSFLQNALSGNNELKEQLTKSPFLLDVRTEQEFAGGSVTGAVNIPLDALDKQLKKLPTDKDHAIVVFCRSGGRASNAQAILAQAGYHNVVNGGSWQNVQQQLPQ